MSSGRLRHLLCPYLVVYYPCGSSTGIHPDCSNDISFRGEGLMVPLPVLKERRFVRNHCFESRAEMS